MNGTHQFLVHTDHVNILGGNTNTIKKNKEALLEDSEKVGLEVKRDDTKHVAMSP